MADRADRIQQRIDENVADLPFFYGRPDKDTITLKHYISRVDQGIDALGWTQAQAYLYFANSIKSTAANWLEHHLTEHPNLAKHWNIVKPFFRRAFGDATDQMVFASDLSSIKIEAYGHNLYDYVAAVTKMCNLHCEKYLQADLVLPQGHGLNEAAQLICRNAVHSAFKTVHDDLRKEFFILGLTDKQKEKITDKPELNTCGKILDFLKREEDLAKKNHKNGNGVQPPLPAATAGNVAPLHDDGINAAGFQRQGQQSNRGQQRGRGQNRGTFRGGQSSSNRGHGYNSGNAGNATNSGSGGSANNPGHSGNQSNNRNQIRFCIYCKKANHKQEVCRQRIADNAPCLDAQGAPFFPKTAHAIGNGSSPNPTDESQNPVMEEESDSVFFYQI